MNRKTFNTLPLDKVRDSGLSYGCTPSNYRLFGAETQEIQFVGRCERDLHERGSEMDQLGLDLEELAEQRAYFEQQDEALDVLRGEIAVVRGAIEMGGFAEFVFGDEDDMGRWVAMDQELTSEQAFVSTPSIDDLENMDRDLMREQRRELVRLEGELKEQEDYLKRVFGEIDLEESDAREKLSELSADMALYDKLGVDADTTDEELEKILEEAQKEIDARENLS